MVAKEGDAMKDLAKKISLPEATTGEAPMGPRSQPANAELDQTRALGPEMTAQTSLKVTEQKSALSASCATAETDVRAAEDHYAYLSIDRAFKANLARLTVGLSPPVLAEQAYDWLAHLAISPGKQLQLVEKWLRETARFSSYVAQNLVNPDTPPCISPLPHEGGLRVKLGSGGLTT